MNIWRLISDWLPATHKELTQTERLIMAKLSTLETTLDSLTAKTDKIAVDVAAIKTSQGDPEIPADAQAALDKLTGSIDIAATVASTP